MQFDIFGEPEALPAEPPADARMDAINALPEKLRPKCAPAAPVPTGRAELDEWTRTNQRLYLLYLIGAIARGIYRESSEANMPYVLAKLNGLGGQW